MHFLSSDAVMLAGTQGSAGSGGTLCRGVLGPHRPGHIALWSLQNACWPVWHFSTSSGVAALDFSRQSPHLLAVGLQDGTVQLHDVKSRQASACPFSSGNPPPPPPPFLQMQAPHLLAVGLQDGMVQLHSVKSHPACSLPFFPPIPRPLSARLLPDCLQEGTMQLHDVKLLQAS